MSSEVRGQGEKSEKETKTEWLVGWAGNKSITLEGELSVSGSKVWPSVSSDAGGSSKRRAETRPLHSGMETRSIGDLGERVFLVKYLGKSLMGHKGFRENCGEKTYILVENAFKMFCYWG